MRVINDAGRALVKEFEGLRLEAYRCPAGVWTIGYGHTDTAHKGMVISAVKADLLLDDDLDKFQRGVAKALKRPATDGQFAAFVSLAFNIGLSDFRSSTALKRFNAGDLAGAAEALTWWNKATIDGRKVKLAGLVRRREAERALFWSDVAEDAETLPVDRPVGRVEGGEAKPITKSKTAIGGLAGLVLSALTAAGEMVEGLPIPPKYLALALMAVCLLLIVNRWAEAARGEH